MQERSPRRTSQARKVWTPLDRDKVDTPDHLLQQEQVSDQEQVPVGAAIGRRRREGFCRRALRNLRGGGDERLPTERDGLAGKVLKDGVLARGGGTVSATEPLSTREAQNSH